VNSSKFLLIKSINFFPFFTQFEKMGCLCSKKGDKDGDNKAGGGNDPGAEAAAPADYSASGNAAGADASGTGSSAPQPTAAEG